MIPALRTAIPLALLLQAGALALAAGIPAARAARPALPDAQIEKAIRAKFAKSKISADNFQVRVENGIAIIEGKTGVIQRKGTATRLAKKAGARGVRNEIQISQEARDRATSNLSAGRRRAQVKRSEVPDRR